MCVFVYNQIFFDFDDLAADTPTAQVHRVPEHRAQNEGRGVVHHDRILVGKVP